MFEKIRTDYVEKPDEGKLVEAAINGMLSSLDPHSSYMDAKSFRDMQVQTKGEFGGLGIEVTQEDGLIKVVTPIDDTPAAKAGILSGDIITDIDGEAVQGLTLNQAVDKMRGAVNTPVTLKIVRGPNKDVKEIKIVRDVIKIQSVRSHVEGDDLGYIRITQFNEQTYDGLKSRDGQVPEGCAGRQAEGLYHRPAQQSRAACSISRSKSSTPSWSAAKSSRRAGATPTRRSATMRGPAATFRMASRWSCSSMAARPRLRKSCRALCRIISAQRSSARARSARAPCRRSSRLARTAPCA